MNYEVYPIIFYGSYKYYRILYYILFIHVFKQSAEYVGSKS